MSKTYKKYEHIPTHVYDAAIKYTIVEYGAPDDAPDREAWDKKYYGLLDLLEWAGKKGVISGLRQEIAAAKDSLDRWIAFGNRRAEIGARYPEEEIADAYLKLHDLEAQLQIKNEQSAIKNAFFE